MLLEICANSYQSAKNAHDAGAHRIELCQELKVGGITPSFGLIKQVTDDISIPVHVLIRPRSGNFVYTDEEFEIMKRDIELCKSLGCEGVVAGILTRDLSIDLKRTKQLVDLARPMQFTFHRAFDEVKNPIKALNQLVSLKVNRVLTSGQSETAEKGMDLLVQLIKACGDQITIMPGSGINEKNAKLFKNGGFQQIHASASTVIDDELIGLFSEPLTVSSPSKIKAILKAISDEI